jgi:hypothetical protein
MPMQRKQKPHNISQHVRGRKEAEQSIKKHPQLDEADTDTTDTRTPDNSDHFLFFADNCDCDAGLTVTCACAVQDPE